MVALSIILLYALPLSSCAFVAQITRNIPQPLGRVRDITSKRPPGLTGRQPRTQVPPCGQHQHTTLCSTASTISTGISTQPDEDNGGPSSPSASSARSSTTAIRSSTKGVAQRVLPYLTVLITGFLFRFIIKGLNKLECFNRETLLRMVFNRGDRGLLTVSNHASIYDDPGLWAAIIPFWRMGRKKMRWGMCTDDIYNFNPQLRTIFKAGNVLPINRARGMEQPEFKELQGYRSVVMTVDRTGGEGGKAAFFNKLEEGEWGHIFAEGAVRQPWRFGKGEPLLGDFKAGIGRLLLRSEDPPLVLPMYHIGMHQVAPETPVTRRRKGILQKRLPNVGRKIRVYVGEPIDVRPIIDKCRAKMGDMRGSPWTERSSKEEVECHKEIASFVRDHMLQLEAVARREYYGTDPSSPYGPVEPESQS